MAALRLTLASILSSLLLFAAPAAAASKLDVAWSAPAGCPAYADVESWLQAVVPPDAREKLAELHVQVVIIGSPSAGFSATVRVSRDSASGAPVRSDPRIVEGPACEEVARSAIVVVSVEMSDVVKAEPAPPREAPAPAPAAAQPAPIQASVQPASRAPARDHAEPASSEPLAAKLLVNVSGGLGSGFADNMGLRVDAGALFALSRSIYWGPRLHTVPLVTIQREDELASLHLVAAGLELCGLPALASSLHAGVCGRAEAGLAWSQGAQAGDPSDSGAVAALGLSPTLSIGGRLRVLVQGDLELRLLRPRFEDDAGVVLASLPIVAGGGLLGLSLAVP